MATRVQNSNISANNETIFHKYWNFGYEVIPVIPPSAELSSGSTIALRLRSGHDARGKVPGVIGDDGLWRGIDFIRYQASEAFFSDYVSWGASLGIKTGKGVIAIDADTLNLDLAKDIYRIVEKHFGVVPFRLGNKPKALYVIRIDEPIPYQRIDFDDGGEKRARVEILSEGRQFVAEGTHPKTLTPYIWKQPLVGFGDLHHTTPEKLAEFMAELKATLPSASEIIKEGAGQGGQHSVSTPDKETLRGKLEHVRSAVLALPNKATREEYIELGYAIKAALPDNQKEAFDIWSEWCMRWEGGTNDIDVIEADWRRMREPYRIGASWIYGLADELSEGRFNKAEVMFDNVENTEDKEGHSEVKAKKRRFQYKDNVDFQNRPPLKWFIKGVLPKADIGIIFGESGSGKSFMALDLAMSIARGSNWNDMKTLQGRVVYICAEGQGGFGNRLAAYEREHNIVGQHLPLHIISDAPNILSSEDVSDLAASILSGGKADLIIIDTMAQVTRGANENSSEHMGKAIENCRLLGSKTGAMVVYVHHTGKDLSRGERGWSGMRADADVRIAVTRTGKARKIKLEKVKDGEDGAEWWFRLDKVVLGTDEDGDVVSSSIFKFTKAPPQIERVEPKGEWQKAIYKAWCDLGRVTTPIDTIIENALINIPKGSSKRDRRKDNLYRAIRELESNALIVISEGNILGIEATNVEDSDDCENI